MGLAAILLLVYSITVVASMLVTAVMHPVRGTGIGPHPPPVREKPSTDEATPARSSIESRRTIAAAQGHTPPA